MTPPSPAPHPAIAPWAAALPPGAPEQLARYVALLLQWNRAYNLTAVREAEAIWQRHIADCLAALPAVDRMLAERRGQAGAGAHAEGHQPQQHPNANPDKDSLRVLDVGSGGGLPGVVWAIARPNWQITCIDAVAKKAAFLQQAAATLSLRNLKAMHGRVEALAAQPGHAQAYGLVTCRAFASLGDWLALTEALAAPGALWCAMKGRASEIASERAALAGRVGGDVHVFHVEPIDVEGQNAERHLVWLRRQSAP